MSIVYTIFFKFFNHKYFKDVYNSGCLLTFCVINDKMYVLVMRGEYHMKTSGIVRRLDPLGRIVLPKSNRDNLDIAIKDDIEIYMDGTSIIVAKHEPRCVFCGETEGIGDFKGKNVCKKCYSELVEMK